MASLESFRPLVLAGALLGSAEANGAAPATPETGTAQVHGVNLLRDCPPKNVLLGELEATVDKINSTLDAMKVVDTAERRAVEYQVASATLAAARTELNQMLAIEESFLRVKVGTHLGKADEEQEALLTLIALDNQLNDMERALATLVSSDGKVLKVDVTDTKVRAEEADLLMRSVKQGGLDCPEDFEVYVAEKNAWPDSVGAASAVAADAKARKKGATSNVVVGGNSVDYAGLGYTTAMEVYDRFQELELRILDVKARMIAANSAYMAYGNSLAPTPPAAPAAPAGEAPVPAPAAPAEPGRPTTPWDGK